MSYGLTKWGSEGGLAPKIRRKAEWMKMEETEDRRKAT